MMFNKVTMSYEDYERLLDEYPGQRLEFIAGEVVEKMPTQLHAYIVQMLSGFLFVFLQNNPIGYALVVARYSLPDDNENDRIPDLSFVTEDKGPLVERGPAPYMPDLAVEVQSPGQSDRQMIDKAGYYLENGSRMVWLIYPDRRLAEIITVDERFLLTQDGHITGGDVLPGLLIPVAAIFPSP